MVPHVKKFFLIASSYPLIKIAWFINNALNINMEQRILGPHDRPVVFFEYTESTSRVSLFDIRNLEFKPLQQFDYLLILEDETPVEIQKLRDSKFVTFVTELDIRNLQSKISKQLLAL